jgi:predicted DNA-binding transcriptional regulator AlpA
VLLEPAIRGLFFRLAVLENEEYITHSLSDVIRQTEEIKLLTASADTQGLIPIADVLSLIPVARSTLYLMMQQPDFPRAVRVGSRVFWKLGEIYAYIDSKKDNAEA